MDLHKNGAGSLAGKRKLMDIGIPLVSRHTLYPALHKLWGITMEGLLESDAN
jgi:hypothetical protein